MAVDFLDGVVDINQREVINARNNRGRCRHVDQPSASDCVELANMAEGEPAPERSQRGGGIGSGE